MQLTLAESRAREKLRYDTPFWAGGCTRDMTGAWRLPGPGAFPGCAKILNKQRQLVRMVPHPWQLQFDDLLEAQRAKGEPMRAIILKARKLGFSTWVALKFLQRLTQIEYQQAVVVAQDTKTANQIFNMALLTHRHLPTREDLGMGFSIRPEIIAQSFSPNGRKFMVFGEKAKRTRENTVLGDSIFEIDTAGTGESIRGYTPSLLHLSEVARWEGDMANRKMLSTLEAVPYEPETIIVLESTANGLNHFHRRWVTACDGAKDPDTGDAYVPLFVPWWRDPNCARKFSTKGDRERFIESIGNESRYGEIAEDEHMLVESYGCTPEQLFWRRMKIREHPDKSVSTFNQENPHSPEAAFIGSGRTVFSGVLIARAIKEAEASPEPVSGTLRPGEWRERRSRAGTVMVPQAAIWVPASEMKQGEHELKVWEHPRSATDEYPPETPLEERGDGAYVIGVDVAEGEANTFSRGDYHAIQIFDHRTRMQVAIHVSRMDIHLLPLWVLTIAIYYNRARLAVEVNGPGIAVVDPLGKDYRYPRMYRRKRIDRVKNVEEDKPGWKTDLVSKPVMEATFGTALQEENHGLRDPKTARELNSYIISERGRHEAQEGEHDDRLMAAMIAHRVMEVLRPPRTGKRKREAWSPQDELTGW